jgi:hypothetical protein
MVSNPSVPVTRRWETESSGAITEAPYSIRSEIVKVGMNSALGRGANEKESVKCSIPHHTPLLNGYS